MRNHDPHQRPIIAFREELSDIVDASIDDLRLSQSLGQITSVDLVHAHLNRINEVDAFLHSIQEVNPDAILIAQQLDAERAAGHLRGPLHGIPILVKDNIATGDRMNNTAGSLALLGATVSREATVIRKLRQAGAIVLGKTTMGEWAQMRSMFGSSSHGWSPLGGQTSGPYHPQQDPSGSSSGSGVAVALGLSLAALATETSGSILLPAEKSNIVGIKPTLGLTSRDMIIPISLRQDTVGPHARSVKDAAYLLSAMAGKDVADNWTNAQPFDSPPDYVKACRRSAFQGARIGVPRNGIDYYLDKSTAPIMDAFEKALRHMRGAGATVIDGADFPIFDPPAFNTNSDLVLDIDFAEGLASYLSQLTNNPNNIHSLEDLIDFTKTDPREEWPQRDIGVWERSLARNLTSSSSESYSAYESNRRMAEEDGIVGALDRYGLDALVMPTFASFRLPAIAGLPVITVPLGFFPAGTELARNSRGDLVNIAPGIPFGISFLGKKWSEETLIGLAYAFEQRTKVRERMKPVHVVSSSSSRSSSISPMFETSDDLSAASASAAAGPGPGSGNGTSLLSDQRSRGAAAGDYWHVWHRSLRMMCTAFPSWPMPWASSSI